MKAADAPDSASPPAPAAPAPGGAPAAGTNSNGSSPGAREPVSRLHAAAFLAALCVLAFANSFGNKFALDDNSIIVENSAIRTLNGWTRLFTSPYWGTQSEDLLYRPLTVLTYALDRAASEAWFMGEGVRGMDLSPWPFHFTNLLLHILATLAWYAFLRALLGRTREAVVGSLAAAAVFAVHPIHVEAVTGIVGRAEVLCAIFYFLGARAYLACRDTDSTGRAWAAYAAAIACFVASLLCKEMGLTLPGILFLCDALRLAQGPGLTWRNLTSARMIAPQTGFLAVILLYFIVRAAVLGRAGPTSTIFALYQTPADVRILTALTVLADYVRLLFVPVGLRAEYAVNVIPAAFSGWSDASAWVSLALLGALVGIAWRTARSAPLVTFCIAWFFLSILPVSNLILGIGAVKAERFLYLPSAAVALAIPWLLGAFRPWPEGKPLTRWGPPVLVAAIGAVLVLFTFATLDRNGAWKDEKTLYADAIAKDPERNARAYSWLGSYYFSYGRFDDAMKQYDRAISIWDQYPQFYEARGRLFQTRKDYRRALEDFNRAVQFSARLNRSGVAHPRLLQARGTLVLELSNQAREEGDRAAAARLVGEAKKDLDLAAKLNPIDAGVQNDCGVLYLTGLQQYDAAIEFFERTLQRDPGNVLAVHNIGLAYYRKKDLERALRWFDAAIQRKPLAITHEARGVALYDLGGDKARAGQDLMKAVQLDPEAGRAYNYLVLCLLDLGQAEQAHKVYTAMRKGGIPFLPEVRARPEVRPW